mmetsp:Transcript_47892/g.154482  ORF Transcript_47892/g.154482 Transcript_47892/m.154482 type:complete len:200 (-) Transcript_47892:3342-3941(-)
MSRQACEVLRWHRLGMMRQPPPVGRPCIRSASQSANGRARGGARATRPWSPDPDHEADVSPSARAAATGAERSLGMSAARPRQVLQKRRRRSPLRRIGRPPCLRHPASRGAGHGPPPASPRHPRGPRTRAAAIRRRSASCSRPRYLPQRPREVPLAQPDIGSRASGRASVSGGRIRMRAPPKAQAPSQPPGTRSCWGGG